MLGAATIVAYIFGLIAFGFCAAKFRLLKETSGDGIADFVFVIAIPLLLVKTLSTADFGSAIPWKIWIVYFAAAGITWVIGHYVIRKIFGRDARSGVVAGLSASFSNTVLLGIPFILGILGEEGFAILTLIVSVHLAVMLAASLINYEWANKVDATGEVSANAQDLLRDFFQKLFLNPLIIGIFAGLLLRFTGLPLPEFVTKMINGIAGVAGPLALFVMGMTMHKLGIRGNVKPALVLTFVKIMIMPAMAFAGCRLLGLETLATQVIVLTAAMPAGVNPFLIATRFGTGIALASNASTIGTGISIVTTFFWLWMVGY